MPECVKGMKYLALKKNTSNNWISFLPHFFLAMHFKYIIYKSELMAVHVSAHFHHERI